MPIYAKRQDLQRFTDAKLDFGPTATKKISLEGNTTFTSISGGVEGERLTLLVQQDATGSRLVTWPAAVVWIGGAAPTLALGAFDVDLIEFYKIGSSYIGKSHGNAAFAAVL